MSTETPLKAAIVGCGRISEIHIETLQQLRGVEVAALCDLDRDRAAECADRYGIAGVFSDVPAMLQSSDADVVHILTPPRTHGALVETAAAHGANVYVEKPLATDESQARSIVEAAHRFGVRVCPGHNRLFDPIFVAAERRIRRGDIGEVVSVRAEQGFTYEGAAHSANIPWSYTYDWGIFENLMPHPLYLVSHFLEEPETPTVVAFDRGSIPEASVEELRVLIPSKAACGEVALTLNAGPERNTVEVVGTRGRIVIDWSSMSVVVQRQGALPQAVQRLFGNLGVSAQLASQVVGNTWGFMTGRLRRYPGMRTLIEAFYRSLQAGSASPVGVEDGVLNARQLEVIRRAAESATKRRPRSSSRITARDVPDVLVTGGTGMLGGALIERLVSEKHHVRATTRLESRVRTADRVDWVRCELGDEDAVKNALDGVSTVYHCAALVAGPGSLSDFEAANVHSTLRLIELAMEAGVERFVYVSSIGVYGCRSRRQQIIDETAPYEAKPDKRGYYTQTKLEAERRLLEWSVSNANPRVTVLRPGTIYGPGNNLPVGRLRLPSPNSRPVVIGSQRVALPLTHVQNLIDVMLATVRHDGPTGRIYNVVDDPDLEQGELARTLIALSDGSVRPLFLPYPVAWMMMLALDVLGAIRNRGFGTARYRLKRTLADMRFPSKAAREDLGWRPRVPLEDGLRDVLERERRKPFPQ